MSTFHKLVIELLCLNMFLNQQPENEVVVPIKWIKFWEPNRLCVTFSGGQLGCKSTLIN